MRAWVKAYIEKYYREDLRRNPGGTISFHIVSILLPVLALSGVVSSSAAILTGVIVLPAIIVWDEVDRRRNL